ncbi:MAG TPA: hypothetical protein DEG43_00220 [Acidimicrobiaceae bacterium]|jgi:hypothetical protein|nr:hypothetical protein [Acidimicrobiaceae bacterium]
MTEQRSKSRRKHAAEGSRAFATVSSLAFSFGLVGALALSNATSNVATVAPTGDAGASQEILAKGPALSAPPSTTILMSSPSSTPPLIVVHRGEIPPPGALPIDGVSVLGPATEAQIAQVLSTLPAPQATAPQATAPPVAAAPAQRPKPVVRTAPRAATPVTKSHGSR